MSQGESNNEQLTILRNNLLMLTRTEPQLQSIKDRALNMPGTKQEATVIEVVQLWQRMFQETFQQYHRLLTRLIRTQEVDTALKLWKEYLTHVQEFLSRDVPDDYNGLSEHRNLCEVYQKLLPEQQNVILTVRQEEDRDQSVTEQFNTLTNLHNETLAKILERQVMVCSRIKAWDKYRLDQRKLLAWLKEMERERQHMSLRFIHVKQLDRTLERIQTLLDKFPDGEAQIRSLEEQQIYLLTNCNEAVAISIRMEHAANLQRITNLRAALQTWRDFIRRIQNFHEEHVDKAGTITATLQEVRGMLTAAFHAAPESLRETKERLDSLQHCKTCLTDTKCNLKSLGDTTEKLRECLNPNDLKALHQNDAILLQQHGELEYELVLLIHKLNEHCALYDRWESRLKKLLLWITEAMYKTQDYDTIALREPEEAIKQCELEMEISLKQHELEWIQSTGKTLIEAEEEEKTKLQRSLDELNDKWNCLTVGRKTRASKLADLVETMNSLLKRITDLQTWLTSVDGQLSEALIIEKISQRNFNKKLEDHGRLQATIEAESVNISQVVNLCKILLQDCYMWKVSFDTEAIKTATNNLERRWEAMCTKSTDRKDRIIIVCRLLMELDKVKCEHESWVMETEKSLLELQNDIAQISTEDSDQPTERINLIAKDIEAHQDALKNLVRLFANVAQSGLDPDNFRSLTSEARNVIERWTALERRIDAIANIEREQKLYCEFISTHGTAIVGLTQVDVRLTQMQHLATPEQKLCVRQRLLQLSKIEKELDLQSVTLQKADELALQVMKESNPEDVAKIQTLVDEYQALWEDITTRVAAFKAELEKQEKSEVDEAVQVETLKFEQDTAVQVDTLPRLVRMTSCDAYLMELETALNDCNNALNALEVAITPQPVAGPGLATDAKIIVSFLLLLFSHVKYKMYSRAQKWVR